MIQRFENVVLFDIRNPNCTIVTPIEKIAKTLPNVPITIFGTVNHFNDDDFKPVIDIDYPIGFVSKVTKVTDNLIFGTIIIMDGYKIKTKYFKNYVINGDKINSDLFEVNFVESLEFELE
jgi:hypothetical protein